jgi:hypothetical protein
MTELCKFFVIYPKFNLILLRTLSGTTFSAAFDLDVISGNTEAGNEASVSVHHRQFGKIAKISDDKMRLSVIP